VKRVNVVVVALFYLKSLVYEMQLVLQPGRRLILARLPVGVHLLVHLG